MIQVSLLAPLVRLIGLEGVGAGALLLVALALYAHKAASVGGVVVSGASTVRHDLQIVAVVLAVLLVLGVLSADPQRTQELLRLGQEWLARQRLLEQLTRWLP